MILFEKSFASSEYAVLWSIDKNGGVMPRDR